MEDIRARILALAEGTLPDHAGWVALIQDASEEDRLFSRNLARERAQAQFGRQVFFRGIIEFTNHCKNDCYYCGIRRSNRELSRYRLTEDEVLTCCKEGYKLGYRTFVLQGGEDGWWTDEKITALVRRIRAALSRSRSVKNRGRRIRRFLTRARTGTCFAMRRRTARTMESSTHPRRRSRTGCDVFLT